MGGGEKGLSEDPFTQPHPAERGADFLDWEEHNFISSFPGAEPKPQARDARPTDGSGWVREQEYERKRWIHQASESTPATTSFIPFPPSIHSKGSWGAGVGPSGSRLGRVQAQAH